MEAFIKTSTIGPKDSDVMVWVNYFAKKKSHSVETRGGERFEKREGERGGLRIFSMLEMDKCPRQSREVRTSTPGRWRSINLNKQGGGSGGGGGGRSCRGELLKQTWY